jgi:hypothetical protein
MEALKPHRIVETEEEAIWDEIVFGMSFREVIVDSDKIYCPVYDNCDVKKVMKERREAERMEYEAFDCMHVADGIGKSERFRKL